MELLKESFFNDEVELKDDDFNQEEVPESKGTYSEVILLDFCWYMTKIEDFKIPLLNKAICLFTNSDYIESYRITIQAFGSYKDYTSEKNIIYEKVISSVSSLNRDGKPLDTNLMRIHMTEIKNYKALTLQDFTKVLLMLSLCGYQFDFFTSDQKN